MKSRQQKSCQQKSRQQKSRQQKSRQQKSRQQKSRQQKSRQQKSWQQKSRQQKSRQQKRIKKVKNNRKRFIGGSNMVPYIATAIAGVGYGIFQKNKLKHLELDLSTEIHNSQQQHMTEEIVNAQNQEEDILRLSNELNEAQKRLQTILNTNVLERLDVIIQPKTDQSKQPKTTFDISDYTTSDYTTFDLSEYNTFANLPPQCSEDKVANFAIRALTNDKKLQDFLRVSNRESSPMLICVSTHGEVKTEKQNNKLIVHTFPVPHNISLTIIYLTKFGLINLVDERQINMILDILDHIIKTKIDLTSFTLMQIIKWIFTQSNKDFKETSQFSNCDDKELNEFKTFNTPPVVVTFLPGEQVIEKLFTKDRLGTNFFMNITLLTPISHQNLTTVQTSTTLSNVITNLASTISGSADIILLDMSCSVTSSANGDMADLPYLIDFFDQQCQMNGLMGGSASPQGSTSTCQFN